MYHCISRIVSGDMRMDREAKEVLRKMLRQVAEFSGVELLAYCLMTNHFHVLIRVPKKAPLSREEVLRRYAVLYEKSNSPGYPDAEGMRLIFAGDDEALIEAWMEKLQKRMGDVSAFIKTLKQRFSVWYNKTHKHFGTLWSERFKSVLVEDSPETLKTVAAYLDLNPVRAGMVKDPAAYRWCSYAEAMAGDALCGAGLARVVGAKDWSEAAASYRIVLFGKGGVARSSEQGVIPAETVERVLQKGGKVEVCELIRCRVRYFSDGAILGSESFVRDTAAALKLRASAAEAGKQQLSEKAPKRLGQLRTGESSKLFSWRDLQAAPISEPSPEVTQGAFDSQYQ